MKTSGPLLVCIMLVKLCYPTGNALVSDNNIYANVIKLEHKGNNNVWYFNSHVHY